jgi:hypothetical protein
MTFNFKNITAETAFEEVKTYISKLEEKVQEVYISSTYSKEKILKEIVKDIYTSSCEVLEKDEENKRFSFSDKINFKNSIINLKKYVEKCSDDNNLNLYEKQ